MGRAGLRCDNCHWRLIRRQNLEHEGEFKINLKPQERNTLL